jgi:hypothetical protein
LALLIGLTQILSLIFIINSSKPNLEECSLSVFLYIIFVFLVPWLALVLVVVLSLVLSGTALWVIVLIGTLLTEISACRNTLLWISLSQKSPFFVVIASICHVLSFVSGIVFLVFFLKPPSRSELFLVFYILWGSFSFLRVFIPFVYLWRTERGEQQHKQQSSVTHSIASTTETQYSESEQKKQNDEQTIGSFTESTPLLKTTSQSINF